jgi:hypothetical protein
MRLSKCFGGCKYSLALAFSLERVQPKVNVVEVNPARLASREAFEWAQRFSQRNEDVACAYPSALGDVSIRSRGRLV